MRLIDADKLRDSVLKWLPPDPCGQEDKEYPFETDICVSMLQEIEEAPTVEPERKTGRWIPWDGDECYECSACRVLCSFHDGTPEENGVHFCPACGADMRRGKHE